MADFWVYCATGATITVTHADGTVLTHLGTNAYHNFNHDYTGVDAFYTGEIVIDTDSGEGSYYFAELITSTGAVATAMSESIQYIYISDYVNTAPSNFLKNLYSCIYIVLSINITSLGSSSLRYAYSLNTLVANNIISCGALSLNGVNLSILVIPNLTILDTSFGSGICGIDNIQFSENLVSINGTSALSSISSCSTIVFNSLIPPVFGSSNILSDIPKSCIIYVPLASLTAYKTNTNMTHLADQMVGY